MYVVVIYFDTNNYISIEMFYIYIYKTCFYTIKKITTD